ncbi:hypothetical protein [Amycolatopsis jejuensis]|uniref:hypothetical protein n=1 Tax=Amycolatopsis jejuensis TaxID=330084 RepID=UPI0005272563|nr:hypothetical protein [Amycolatopsis jejuensis]
MTSDERRLEEQLEQVRHDVSEAKEAARLEREASALGGDTPDEPPPENDPRPDRGVSAADTGSAESTHRNRKI